MPFQPDRRWWVLILLLALLVTPGCEAVAGIFKAGVWVGVIMAALVVGVVLWLVMGRRSA